MCNWNETDSQNKDFSEVQKMQNKLLRLLNGVRLSDRINTKTLLQNKRMLSVNQMNAQCKLLEIWKSLNITDYPFKPNPIQREEIVVNTLLVS